ncbi:hypothetical protein ABID60_006320 [Bradyrhizobium sp. S3.5.5]
MILRRLAGTIASALVVASPILILPMAAAADSSYATPTRDGRERIQRTGTCPIGFVGLGDKCEALHRDTPRAYPHIPGTACPSATFRSGDACKAFR